MPEHLTKKIEVEGDGSKIQEQVPGFKSSSFASPKSPRAFLKSSVYLTIAQGREAAASGTDASRHTEDWQRWNS